jgi:hypothetical protein
MPSTSLLLFILALAFAALNLFRWTRQREPFPIVMTLMWAVLAWRIIMPMPFQNFLIIGLLGVALYFKFRKPSGGKGGQSRDPLPLLPDLPGPHFAAAVQPVEVRLHFPHSTALEKLDGGTFHVPPGEYRAAIELVVAPGDQPAAIEAECTGTLHFPDGTAQPFGYPIDLSAAFNIEKIGEDSDTRDVHLWEAAPEALRQAFEKRCLLASTEIGYDGRVRFPLEIAGRTWSVMTKYNTATIDVAPIEDGRRLAIRVRGLQAESGPGDLLQRDEAEAEDADEVPPFCFSLPTRVLTPTDEA